MESNAPNKLKLLEIWEILNMMTDSEHQMTTQQLIDELAKCNISSERKSIYRDIETLRSNGYEILKGRSFHDNTYYVNERRFSVSEIKIIMDAVQSAAFIPADKTEILLDKLAYLSCKYRVELLKRHTVQFMTVKHKNDSIFQNIEIVENAIEKQMRIRFQYFHLNEYDEKVFAHDGVIYQEEPLGLIFEDGNYYLLCYRADPEYVNKVKAFRLDRIEDPEIVSEPISQNAVEVLKNVSTYRLQSFKMYGGSIRKVTLQFSPNLIEVVYDKFGHDIIIRRNGDICKTTVLVQISPTLWGWMLQFPGSMKIYEPEDIREEYYKWVRSALEQKDQQQ